MKAYWALFRSNMRLTMRDRGVLFFNYMFPLIFFFAFAEMFHAGTGQGIAYFVGTVLTMGILGNGLWGAGMRSVQEREANILRRFKVTPISPLPLLVASMASGWLLYLPVIALIAGLAHFIYAMPLPEHWISLVVMASLGVCALRAIGLILAAVTNTMAEANILIQLVYMPMLFLSGTTIPSSILPVWAQTVAEFMPATYLVTGFQGIFFRNQSIFDNIPAVGALLLTAAMGLFLAVKLFRWEKEEKIAPRNRLWVAGVLAPFLIMGCWRSYTKEHIGQNEALFRATLRHPPDPQHPRLPGRRHGEGERQRAGARRQDRGCLQWRRSRRRETARGRRRRLRQDAAARADRRARAPLVARRHVDLERRLRRRQVHGARRRGAAL